MKAMLTLMTGMLVAGPAIAAGPAHATPAGPAAALKHSGTIVRVDPVHHAMTIAEMGPWHGPGTKLVRHVVELGPHTVIQLEPPSPAVNGARSLAPAALRAGDYATVTATRHGHTLEATEIDVVRPAA